MAKMHNRVRYDTLESVRLKSSAREIQTSDYVTSILIEYNIFSTLVAYNHVYERNSSCR